MSDAARLKATIYIGHLDQSVTAQILSDAFLPFGEIVDVTLPKPEAATKEPHRGFGYVEFEQAADAREAIDNMDQSELFGRVIKVAAARPQKDSAEGLGSKTAVWEQEGWLARNAVSAEDRAAASADSDGAALDVDAPAAAAATGLDPMQGLDQLDYAGPNPD